MKNTFILILLWSVWFNLAAQSEENALLWEISGNGLEKPSYIFGTVHIIPEEDYFFTDKMKEKFDSCDRLVLETDIFNLSLSDKLYAAQKIIIPDGKNLYDYMSKDDSVRFKTYLLDTLKISKKTFKRILKLKPMMSSALILNELLGKTKTYEEELYKLAKKNKSEISGLETLKFQIDLVDKISIEEQVEMMFNDELSGDMLEEYRKLIEVYKTENLTELKNMIDKDDSMAKLGDDFIKNRNIDWIEKIEKFAKEKPSFIAVGAAHLGGKEGVLNLLREKGYNVKPAY